MADIDMLTENDDDKEPKGELITVDMSDEEPAGDKQTARTKDDNTAAAATRSEDDDEVEVVVASEQDKNKNRKQTPKERRALQRAARDRERQEKAQLAKELADLKAELAQVKQSGTRRDVVMIDERIAEAKKRFEEAEELMATAVSKGEGEAHVRLLRIRDAAAREHDELLQAKQQLSPETQERVERVQPQVSQQEKLRVVAENTQRFQARHTWYGKDAAASEVVKELDASVYAAGYDPATSAYWQELERRIKEAQEDGDIVIGARSNQRRTPPSGVDRATHAPSKARNQQIFVSQARIDAMKEAGQWDDPKTRNRVLKRYAEYDRNNQTAR